MIIDGNKLILGRVASVVAKKAFDGEFVIIVNCEKMIVTGSRKFLLNKFKERQDKGHPYHGPFLPKMPDRLVKRVIRGMLPYKKERGRNALKKVMCYIGIPEKYKTQKFEIIRSADYSKLKTLNFMSISEYSKYYGKKI